MFLNKEERDFLATDEVTKAIGSFRARNGISLSKAKESVDLFLEGKIKVEIFIVVDEAGRWAASGYPGCKEPDDWLFEHLASMDQDWHQGFAEGQYSVEVVLDVPKTIKVGGATVKNPQKALEVLRKAIINAGVAEALVNQMIEDAS